MPDEFRGGKAPTIILANFNPSAVAGTAPAQNAPAVAPVAPVAAPEAPGPMKSTTGPLKSVRVFVAHKMARELDDGETATVALNGGDVTFEAYTMGKKVGKVYFQINGVADKHVEMNPPYVFRGNKGAQYNIWPKSQAILNRQFKLTITLQDGTQKYEKSVMLTLTN